MKIALYLLQSLALFLPCVLCAAAVIPNNQFPVHQFQQDLWHPSLQKKYLDDQGFIIVNHERPGLDTYVELINQVVGQQEGTQSLDFNKIEKSQQQPETSLKIEGLNCNCKFVKKQRPLVIQEETISKRGFLQVEKQEQEQVPQKQKQINQQVPQKQIYQQTQYQYYPQQDPQNYQVIMQPQYNPYNWQQSQYQYVQQQQLPIQNQISSQLQQTNSLYQQPNAQQFNQYQPLYQQQYYKPQSSNQETQQNYIQDANGQQYVFVPVQLQQENSDDQNQQPLTMKQQQQLPIQQQQQAQNILQSNLNTNQQFSNQNQQLSTNTNTYTQQQQEPQYFQQPQQVQYQNQYMHKEIQSTGLGGISIQQHNVGEQIQYKQIQDNNQGAQNINTQQNQNIQAAQYQQYPAQIQQQQQLLPQYQIVQQQQVPVQGGYYIPTFNKI